LLRSKFTLVLDGLKLFQRHFRFTPRPKIAKIFLLNKRLGFCSQLMQKIPIRYFAGDVAAGAGGGDL
jgi:hypothetical protein